MIKPCCHTCKYVGNVNEPWSFEPSYTMAWCHRHAPVVDKDGKTVWPQVYETSLCGDYELSSEFVNIMLARR